MFNTLDILFCMYKKISTAVKAKHLVKFWDIQGEKLYNLFYQV